MQHPDAALFIASLPIELRGNLEQAIPPDETILWVGQPEPLQIMIRKIPRFLAGICFTGIGGAICYAVVVQLLHFSNDMLLSTALIGLFFAGLGVALIASPFRALAEAKRTIYVVTDHNVFSLEGADITPTFLSSRSLKSVERKDGTGDLLFSFRSVKGNWWQSWRYEYYPAPLSEFSAIKNPKYVEELIRRTFPNT
jgi:hypothetical protein